MILYKVIFFIFQKEFMFESLKYKTYVTKERTRITPKKRKKRRRKNSNLYYPLHSKEMAKSESEGDPPDD